jgi:hypothetical protein
MTEIDPSVWLLFAIQSSGNHQDFLRVPHQLVFSNRYTKGIRMKAGIGAALVLTVTLSACGGGSGHSAPGGQDNPPDPGDPPSQDNQSPQLVNPATDQRPITGHLFSYDASLE